MQHKGLTNIGIIYNKIPVANICIHKKYVTKRLPELLPEVTLLGFIGNDQIVENQLKNNASKEIALWFSSYVDERTLLYDWLGLKTQNHD
jgi:hypothetical protein